MGILPVINKIVQCKHLIENGSDQITILALGDSYNFARLPVYCLFTLTIDSAIMINTDPRPI